jgi:hypothetical protein
MLIAGNDTTPATHMDLVIEVVLMIAAGAVVVFVARPAVFTRQICFLLFLVAVLVAVSELSKLGINLQPPKPEPLADGYSEPAATNSLHTAAVVPTVAPVASAASRTDAPLSRADRIALRS